MGHKISSMVLAMQGWNEIRKADTAQPDGIFGQKVTISFGGVKITNDELDVEFNIPFDDDFEPNEAEIVFWNLSKATISKLAYNTVITVTAGYTGDTGVIFSGRISKRKTKHVGVDKQTTVYAIDKQSLQDKTLKTITYKAGTKASYILKDLLGRLNTPIAVFKPRRDYTYKDSVTVEDSLFDAIQKYSQVCGVSSYFCKGKIYARWIKDGDNINFTVEEATGLIGSPEAFEEEIRYEDKKETVKGYKVKMLLQHRITTASIINLKSVDVKGKYRVRSGSHTYNGNDFYTEMEVI